MRRAHVGWLIMLAGLLLGPPALAQGPSSIPSTLQEWAPWVLQGEEYRSCALRPNSIGASAADFACQSSQGLDMKTAPTGVSFSAHIKTDTATLWPLPGDSSTRPQRLAINGQPTVAIPGDQAGSVRLPAGTHHLTGLLPGRLERLTVPSMYGTVRLEGRALSWDGGQVWLTPKPAEGPAPVVPDSVEVHVWRALIDGPALELVTHVRLDVSGVSRRLDLGPLLPRGFVPTGWTSNTPAVLTPQGHLLAQVRPGQLTIEVSARCLSACDPVNGVLPADSLRRPKHSTPWPEFEVWSVVSAPAFRQLVVEGAGVDAAQAQVPPQWQSSPAYRVGAEAGLQVQQVARGRRPGEGEDLTLQRRIWSGAHQWVVEDQLTGQLPVGGRLSMNAPHTLERAASAHGPIPLNVDGAGVSGVQWPAGPVGLHTQSVVPTDHALDMGWNARMDRAQLTLHLRPGEVLLATPGAKPGSGSMMEHWRLPTLFLAVFLGLIIRQVLGWRLGVLACVLWLGYAALTGPHVLLLALGAAGVTLLVSRLLPAGPLSRFLRVPTMGLVGVAMVAWLFLATPQVRQALYPHLSVPRSQSMFTGDPRAAEQGAASSIESNAVADQAPMPAAPPAARAPMEASAMNDRLDATLAQRAVLTTTVDTSNASAGGLEDLGVAQAGRAQPTWSSYVGTTHQITYAGPLLAADTTPLWIVPSWLTRLLRVLGVLGLAVLIGRMLQLLARPHTASAPPPTTALLITGLVLMCAPGLAGATPTPELLAELKTRLTAPPACAPHCVGLAQTHLEISGNTFVARYEVISERASVWVVPTVTGATSHQALVNGAPAWFAQPGHILLPRGLSRVELRHTILPATQSLQWSTTHDVVDITTHVRDAWQADVINGAPLLSNSWSAQRSVVGSPTEKTSVDLPAATTPTQLVHVERTFVLGREMTLTTHVRRMDQGTTSAVVIIPRLEEEHAQSEQIEATAKGWRVVVPAGGVVSWTSMLPAHTQWSVGALPADTGVQVWSVVSAHGWHVDGQGAPESQPQNDPSGQQKRVWIPQADEKLQLTLARLPVQKADTQRVDNAHISSQFGPRQSEHELTLTITATQAGVRSIRLPDDLVLKNITRNSEPLSLTLDKNTLNVPVLSGPQTINITALGPPAPNMLVRAPSIDWGGPVSNATWTLNNSAPHWLLATGGQGYGPAIQLWPVLLVALVLGYALTRWRALNITPRQMVFLVLGFATFALPLLVALVAWRALLAARVNPSWPQHRLKFNLLQCVLALGTVVLTIVTMMWLSAGLWSAVPNMMVAGPSGLPAMSWLLPDHAAGVVSGPWLFVVPLWVYQVLLFVWAVWFAQWLWTSLKNALAAWMVGGYWRVPPTPPTPPAPQADPPAAG